MSIADMVAREQARVQLTIAMEDAAFLTSAIEEMVETPHVVKFMASGMTPQQWVEQVTVARPHLLKRPAIEPELIEQAFGAKPSLQARGVLYAVAGAAEFNKIAAEWSADLRNLNPGTRPSGNGDKGSEKKPTPGSNKTNPWSAAGWSLARQGQIVKTLGVEKAASIAKAVGCKLGSTKPNPAFN